MKNSTNYIPVWFKVWNMLSLLPLLFWPYLFFLSMSFFDSPDSSPVSYLKAIVIILYPVLIFYLWRLNSRLYRQHAFPAVISPLVIVAGFIASVWFGLFSA